MVRNKMNELSGGEDLPSGAVEEHNSLWPCHEGAPLQTCRQGEKGQQSGYSTCTQLSLYVTVTNATGGAVSHCETLSNMTQL